MKRCRTNQTVQITVHKDMLKRIENAHKELGKKKYSRVYITKLLARRL